MKKNRRWLIAIAIIIVILIALVMTNKKSDSLSGIVVHYYKDGKEVKLQSAMPFSLVTPPGIEFDQISFDILGTNTGNTKIYNMQIVDAYPLEFKNALPTIAKSLEIGESKILWSSNLIDSVSLGNYPKPLTLIVNIKGEDAVGNRIINENSITLNIYNDYTTKVITGSNILADLTISNLYLSSGNSNYYMTYPGTNIIEVDNDKNFTKVLYITFGSIDSIPNDVYLKNAFLNLTYGGRSPNPSCSEDINLELYNVYSPIQEINSYENPSFDWISQPCGKTFDNEINCNLTSISKIIDISERPYDFDEWGKISDLFDVTNILKRSISKGENTITFLIKIDKTTSEENHCNYYWIARDDEPIDDFPALKLQPKLMVDYYG